MPVRPHPSPRGHPVDSAVERSPSPVYGAGLLNGVKANYAPPQAGFRRSEAIAHRYKNGEPQFVHVRPSALLVAMMAQ